MQILLLQNFWTAKWKYLLKKSQCSEDVEISGKPHMYPGFYRRYNVSKLNIFKDEFPTSPAPLLSQRVEVCVARDVVVSLRAPQPRDGWVGALDICHQVAFERTGWCVSEMCACTQFNAVYMLSCTRFAGPWMPLRWRWQKFLVKVFRWDSETRSCLHVV